MSDPQSVNQLFFTIFGLILACLFAGTFNVGRSESVTRRFWLLSVGTRAGAFFAWAAIPLAGGVSVVLANGLFVFSAGCLALLFRSWRVPVGTRLFTSVTVLSLAVGIGMEILRQSHLDFSARMILIGVARLVMTGWTLAELMHPIRAERETSLRLVAATVLLQILLSIASIAGALLYVDRNIVYVTDNATRSMFLIWSTMGVHLVVYLFIGGHLFRRTLLRELVAVRQRDDVTALLQEREGLLASLIASNRIASTGALSASVAHEISQPLQATMLTLGLLRRAIDRPSGAKIDLRPLVIDAIAHLGRSKEVLDHLRSLFRQDAAPAQPCDLHELVSETVMLLQSRLNEAGVKLDCSPAPQVSAPIIRKEMQQVLINLINNAIDSLAGASTLQKAICITIRADAERATIEVADNGRGLQPGLADSLFELARSDKADGMGIGLWISRYIIEDHHRGRLYVNHRHAPGASFVIELPR